MIEKDTTLSVSDLQAFYGESHILHGMEFRIGEGEIVALLGRNGAGKTTTLKSIIGLVEKRTGIVSLRGTNLVDLKSHVIARRGVAYCPEERGIFSSLTVKENLLLPPIAAAGGLTAEEIFSLFPILKERQHSQGTKLSGGEQQMLAMGRMLVSGAKLLLIDEPTEGLAPVIVSQIGDVLRQLRQRGYTIVLVEQNLRFVSSVADRHYIVEGGRVVDEIGQGEFDQSRSKIESYLGL